MGAGAQPRLKALADLYARSLREFVSARKAAVASTRSRSPELAKILAAAKKPSLVVWAIDALAREAHRELERYLALSAPLRAGGSAGKKRDLAKAEAERQVLLEKLVARATDILRREGGHVTPATERRLRSTLYAAAFADDEVRQALEAGALDHELEASALDVVSMLQASSALARPGDGHPSRRDAPARRRRAAAERKADALAARADTIDDHVRALEAELERSRAEAQRLRDEARALRRRHESAD